MEADRWEALFADLAGEFAAADAADLRSEVADRTRHEYGSVRLVDRLRPAVGHPIRIANSAGVVVTGRLTDVGGDWVLVAEPSGSALVPLAHVTSVTGLGPLSATPGSEGRVVAALRLRHALRRLARDRAGVVITTVDGAVTSGTLDRVGADFVEIAEHPPGEPRRPGCVRQVRTVPVAAVAVLRSS